MNHFQKVDQKCGSHFLYSLLTCRLVINFGHRTAPFITKACRCSSKIPKRIRRTQRNAEVQNQDCDWGATKKVTFCFGLLDHQKPSRIIRTIIGIDFLEVIMTPDPSGTAGPPIHVVFRPFWARPRMYSSIPGISILTWWIRSKLSKYHVKWGSCSTRWVWDHNKFQKINSYHASDDSGWFLMI